MCEANAYIVKDGEERLIMESVDVVEPDGEGGFRLIGIFGDQVTVKGRIKRMALVDHKILFEEGVPAGEHEHAHRHRHEHAHEHDHLHSHGDETHGHPHAHVHAHEHPHPHQHAHPVAGETDVAAHDHPAEDDHGPHHHEHEGHYREPHDHPH